MQLFKKSPELKPTNLFWKIDLNFFVFAAMIILGLVMIQAALTV